VIKNSILTDSRIAATLDLASQSQVAIFGVGNISKKSSLYKAGYLNDAMMSTLENTRAVGDIAGRFFDRNGNICVPEFDERTIAVKLETLRSKRISVAVAAGLEKLDAMRGMLAGKYCNVLITDKNTANALLSNTTGS
jgi:deoxyribonucleoside regulator